MSMGLIGAASPAPAPSVGRSMVLKRGRSGGEVRCAAGRLTEEYRTLRVHPGASENEVKKAFRQLALQYHPDVCKGTNCSVQFHRINEAYDIVISSLRRSKNEQEEKLQEWIDEDGDDEDGRSDEMCDPSWELWEEWMGWEGAGIRDYSSHINPYV